MDQNHQNTQPCYRNQPNLPQKHQNQQNPNQSPQNQQTTQPFYRNLQYPPQISQIPFQAPPIQQYPYPMQTNQQYPFQTPQNPQNQYQIPQNPPYLSQMPQNPQNQYQMPSNPPYLSQIPQNPQNQIPPTQPNAQPSNKPDVNTAPTNTDVPQQQKHKSYGHDEKFTDEELYHQAIASENKDIVLSKKYPLTQSETIIDCDYDKYYKQTHSKCNKKRPNIKSIKVTNYSTISTAIYIHKKFPNKRICLLNFADAFKCGGGYLNGRSPQEETLCRQTLLYPTLVPSNMYSINAADKNNVIAYDTMVYSPDVFVIRDDGYGLLKENAFKVNIISSPAVDKRRKHLDFDANQIMERRIRKIILLAAYKKNDVLILGAFGCGVFRNDPKIISQIFRKILVDECLANYFDEIVFPIYKSEKNYAIFKNVLK